MLFFYDLPPLVHETLGEEAFFAAGAPVAIARMAGDYAPVPSEGACVARCDFRWDLSSPFRFSVRDTWPVPCDVVAGPMPDGGMLCAVHAYYWWADHDARG